MPSHHRISALPTWEPGQSLGGFDVTAAFAIPNIAGRGYALVHRDTGARYLHIAVADRENAFGVAFKTVPSDDSGVAHILEHTVLCGSQRFPVRDPFFAMLKRSLSTFMNAFTASDWTLYPFATQNRKDFYNLLDVYLDATFFPKLDAASFRQEGHRLEFADDPDGGTQLVFKGIVYNEMKGAMSSPDQVLARSLLNALYPATAYRFNSGGDPQSIPDLTHADLRAFHQRHYHPSNAYFFSYGDLPLEAHLDFIAERVLQHFGRIDPDTDVAPQPRWSAPRTAVYRYPLAPGEDPQRKWQIGLGWLVADIRDSFEVLVLSLIEQLLIGNPASPLRRALLESELGSALADSSGFDADNRDTLFFCGLKDVAAEDGPRIEAIIGDTLSAMVRDGIDPQLIDAAIHQVEFHRREISNTPFPYGLKLLLSITGTWLHGGDPAQVLDIDGALQRLAEARRQGRFFEERLQAYFLDNPHRLLFKLQPDLQLQDRARQDEASRLKGLEAKLEAADRKRIQAEARELLARQESTEDVSVLPTLELTDIPPTIEKLEESFSDAAHRLRGYRQPTGGIFYFNAAFALPGLPDASLSLLPLLTFAFSRMGTARADYGDLARRLDLYTGGVGLALHARRTYDAQGACTPLITLRGKCLARNQVQLFALLEELALEVRFTDLPQLKRLLLEYRAALESAVIHNGHRLAISLASRNLTPSARLNEAWFGVHQLQTVKQWGQTLQEDGLNQLAEALTQLTPMVLRADLAQFALIGEEDLLAAARPQSEAMLARLPVASADRAAYDGGQAYDPTFEGWSTATAVAFVSQVFPCVRYTHPDAPALAAIAKMLRSLYLHREIREKGGAYGGFALYSPEDGLMAMASYRDPHIVQTLGAFRGAGDFIRSGAYRDEDIKEAILQVCSEIDKPNTPAAAARKAFYRRLVGLEDEARLQFKARLLRLERREIQAVAERYFDPARVRPATAVIASEAMLDDANRALAPNPLGKNAI
jgi:Zn-dependent M16 (insulinase) family peptidase